MPGQDHRHAGTRPYFALHFEFVTGLISLDVTIRLGHLHGYPVVRLFDDQKRVAGEMKRWTRNYALDDDALPCQGRSIVRRLPRVHLFRTEPELRPCGSCKERQGHAAGDNKGGPTPLSTVPLGPGQTGACAHPLNSLSHPTPDNEIIEG